MMNKRVFEYGIITLGVLFLSLGFYFFLQPMELVIGGMMGVTVLVERFIPISNAIFLFCMNIIALTLGGLVFGKSFFMRTIYATIVSPLIIFIFEVTKVSDRLIIDHIDPHYQLLIATIAGGLLVGVGLGLVLRNNSTTGGMDIYQRMLQKAAKIPFAWAVYITDGLVISLGMLVSIQNGMFGLMSLFISAFVLERVAVAGRNSYTVLIVTDFAELMKQHIFEIMNRGLTRIKAIGGYSNLDKEMILCTVSRSQVYMLKTIVSQTDPKAFTLILQTKEVLGEGFHRDNIS